MKKFSVFFMIILPFYCFGQVNENFSDGNFANNPVWSGTTANFKVNGNLQLQSQAAGASTSWLFTPSEAIENAVWECWIKVAYATSSSNYACVYLISDRDDLTNGCNGYYVQIGGANDEVSLFLQEGNKKTKIIDGFDKRTDGNLVELRIRVTRDADGNFILYSKLPSEPDFVLEGRVQNNAIRKSSFFGLMFSNTATTGAAYFFDDIMVSGEKAVDKIPPVWTSLRLEQPNRLILGFSEPMDFSNAAFGVDNEIGCPSSQKVSNDGMSDTLLFNPDFERGRIYNLQVGGLKDLAGNPLPDESRNIGIIEPKSADDLVINEIMFDNPVNSLEYIEIFNRSDKLLDVSGMVLASRKSDGTFNTGIILPDEKLLLPMSYLAICEDADSVRHYHRCPPESNIFSVEWQQLNNDHASVALLCPSRDTVFDELPYNVKWHHVLVKNPKGVALERINPQLPAAEPASWHSAASEVNYGTPGYRNSQYRDLAASLKPEKFAWVEPGAFSPDNDGTDDICLIRYLTEASGFVANVRILSPAGENICQLASEILISPEGFLTWDGRTDKGRVATPGVYVIYFEMFNPQTGVRRQVKLPVVVSSR